MNSKFLGLNLADLGKGLLVAFLAVFVTSIGVSLDAGSLPTVADLLQALKVAGVAALSYLLKNLVSNSAGQPLKKEPSQEA